MKRIITLFVVIVMVLSMAVVTSSAEEIPTAKIVATLVGDSVPVVGEKFVIAISATEITTNLFVSGEIGFEYPVEVVTPVRYTKAEPTIVTNARQMIGGITNNYSSNDCTGKFSIISKIDLTAGKGAVAVYIDINAEDQAAEVLTDGTFDMFGFAFMLNEGYTYEDFYFTLILEDAGCFLTADKQIVSRGRDGNIAVDSIGRTQTVVDANVAVQSSYVTEELAKETGSNINLEVLSKEIVNTFAAESVESDLSAEINILYNSEYHEAVLKANNVLNASLTITNSGTADTNCVCYIAEYNADGCMTGMARNSEISVPAGETVVTNVSKTFSSSNTAKAKIFLWEKGTLVPVGDDIILTAKSADYYANTYATSDSVETNKQICGVINVNTDVDIVKFQTTNAGMYALKFSADNGAAFGLYNLEGKLINAASVDGNYRAYNLSENETYYIKMTGNVNNSYRIKPMVSENVIKNIGVAENLTDVYDCDLYEFTPEEAGSYIITAVGTDGVEATLYNSDFKKLKDSEPGDSYVSFRITESLIANEKYYIVVEQNAGQTEETAYELYIEEPFEIIAVQ